MFGGGAAEERLLCLGRRLDDGGTEAGREVEGEGGGALVEVLRDQVEHLRSELAEEREARRRADTIIAQLAQANASLAARVPELEAPAGERPGAAETAPEVSEGARELRSGSPVSQEIARRPWWKRVFGG